MSKSLIQTSNISSQNVAVGSVISLGSVLRRFGCNCRLNGSTVEVEGEGYYIIDVCATATPTVADAYWNVNGFAIIDVPTGCCYTVSVENASVSADPTTTPALALNLRNLNVEVTRLA